MSKAEFLDRKYNELKAIYEDFISRDSVTLADRTEFLNNAFNCMNVMNKIIAIAVNGNAAENQVILSEDEKTSLPEESEVPETAISEADREAAEKAINEIGEKLNEVLDPTAVNRGEEFIDLMKRIDEGTITDEEILKLELDAYGISSKLAGYKNMLKIPVMVEGHPEISAKSEYEDILNALAEVNGITSKQLEKNINNIISKANFENAVIMPLFRNIVNDGKQIHIKLFLREFIDLFIAEEE